MVDRNFDDWISAYIEYTQHQEAPISYRMWTAIATVAGALRGKCWIDMGYFKWKPNFFLVFVAKPGIANKSTTTGIGMDLLREVKGVKFGPDSVTWQALTQAFAENVETATIPGHGKMRMSSMTVNASELGTFLDMRNREMIDVLVDLWDGRNVPWTRKTKGGGEERIPNPWINLIAGTTPSWISEHMPEYAIGGGFTSRTIFVFADQKEQLVPYPSLEIPPEIRELRNQLISDLNKIAKLSGEFRLTKRAYDAGHDWYISHWQDTPMHLLDDRLQGYVSRKQTHLHKIAMVVSAARRNDMIIDLDEFERALTILGAVEGDMTKVFNAISDKDEVQNIGILLSKMKILLHDTPHVDKKSLYRSVAGRMGFQDFEIALQSAVAAGYAEQQQRGDTVVIRLQDRADEFLG